MAKVAAEAEAKAARAAKAAEEVAAAEALAAVTGHRPVWPCARAWPAGPSLTACSDHLNVRRRILLPGCRNLLRHLHHRGHYFHLLLRSL